MWSKNSKALSNAEKVHLGMVRDLACSVCDAPGPSEAHHIEQGLHFVAVALCVSCHRGPSGWHGTKALWRIRKLDEIKALNITLQRLA